MEKKLSIRPTKQILDLFNTIKELEPIQENSRSDILNRALSYISTLSSVNNWEIISKTPFTLKSYEKKLPATLNFVVDGDNYDYCVDSIKTYFTLSVVKHPYLIRLALSIYLIHLLSKHNTTPVSLVDTTQEDSSLSNSHEKLELTAILWNGNCRSDSTVEIADFLWDKVDQLDCDLVVINEIMENTTTINAVKSLANYNYSFSKTNLGNQILILYKKSLNCNKIIYKIPNISSYFAPYFFHLQLELNNHHINLIGSKIRISDGSEEDYLFRMEQFKNLAGYISSGNLKNLIVLADLNNSRILGEMSSSFNKVKNHYFSPRKKQAVYNYQLINDILKSDGYQLYTPVEGYSWGLENKRGNYTYGYIKNDHLIASLDPSISVTVDYLWDFVKENPSYYSLETPAKGTPDHGILLAKIEIG